MSREIRRLLIADEHLKNIEGHYYEYNKSVVEAFRQHGVDTVVYASTKVTAPIREELNARPWFYHHPKAGTRRLPIVGPILYRLGFWARYRHRLRAMIAQELQKGDDFLLLVPNVYWYNILPLAQVLKNADFPVVVLFRMSIYDRQGVPGSMRSLILPLIRHAVNKLRNNKNVVYATDSDVISREWEDQFHLPMKVLPIPHLNHSPEGQAGQQAGDRLRLCLPGALRAEKGAALLTDAFELMAGTQPDLLARLTLVTQFISMNDELQQWRDRLAALPLDHEFLGSLSSEEYNRQIELADIILIPYQVSEGYRARTSGILAEAMAASKPFITTAGTWMAVQALAYDTGLVVAEDAAALVSAIREMTARYPEFQEKARNASKKWAGFHTKENFYRILTEPFT